MPNTPMVITLYGEDDEIKATYTRSFVPWKLLKMAVRLSKTLNTTEDITEEDLDKVAALVVEVFGNRFSVDDLNAGADTGEMIAVINAIMSRASGFVPNTPPRT